jgi:AcrR family transcriptional regulator
MPKKKTVRTPKQKRSIETKNRIKEAAAHLFAENGVNNTNSNQIAEEAGTAIGSFYAYFPDKKALLLELLDEYLAEHYTDIWGQAADGDFPHDLTREFVRRHVENLFRAYSKSPKFHRETHVLRYSDPDVRTLYDKDIDKELNRIKALIRVFKNEVRVEDLDAAALVIQCAAENVAHAAKLRGTEIGESRLINELTDMIYRYLVGREAE